MYLSIHLKSVHNISVSTEIYLKQAFLLSQYMPIRNIYTHTQIEMDFYRIGKTIINFFVVIYFFSNSVFP